MDKVHSSLSTQSVKSVLAIASQRLANAGCDTPGLDAELLLAHTLEKDRTWLYQHFQESLSEIQLSQFYDLLGRRERREPVAYIIGHKEFFGLDFEVNPRVLIPRPETELLVETAIQLVNCQFNGQGQLIGDGEKIPQKPKFTIADVGTGSGCIAIALARNLPGASVFAIDTSVEALQVAQRNADRHGVMARITFLTGNLLRPLHDPVDLIVSNPPYIRTSDLTTASVGPEISLYEPSLALDGGEDGLTVIRRLLGQAEEKLKPGSTLLIEIGATQGQAVSQLARSHFDRADVQVKKDLAGLERLLVVRTESQK